MANIIKCPVCNVVINECLTFIQNKIQVMDNESLIRICVTGFSDQDITAAKSLLFNAVTTAGKRKIVRKKDGRLQRDLEDMISLFKETDPENIPLFVARDLFKLPPICFDSLDVTHLLKKLLLLQEDVKTIKANYVTKDMLPKEQSHEAGEALQLQDSPSPPLTIPAYRYMNVNCKRGASKQSFAMDSGPIGLSPAINGTVGRTSNLDSIVNVSYTDFSSVDNKCITNNRAKNYHSPSKKINGQCAPVVSEPQIVSPQVQHQVSALTIIPTSPDIRVESQIISSQAPYRPGAVVTTVPTSPDIRTERPTIAQALTTEGDWKKTKPTEEWIQVNRRRYRNRLEVCIGKAQNKKLGNFRAAESMVSLFISNVHKDTTERDIIDYIFDNTKEKVNLIRINMKKDKDYNSYKLWVPKYKLDLFLNDQLWPEGINFRQFVYFKNVDENTASNNIHHNV